MESNYPLLSTSFREKLNDLHTKYPDNKILIDILKADDIIESNKTSFSSEIKEQLSSIITDFGRMITFRENSELISFLPKGKLPIYNENGNWSTKNRQCSKPAKFFQKLLVHKYTCKEFEDFSNLIKYEILNTFEFKIVTGEDVRKYYNEDTYYKNTGTLGVSCMRYNCCSDYFDIYVDKAQMLIAFKDSKVIGRALLWTLHDGTIFMDRIYCCFDWLESTFIQYAKHNKWIIRVNNDILNDGHYLLVLTSSDDYKEAIILREEIQLDKKYRKYPYMDSFRYFNTEQNIIKTYPEDYQRNLSYSLGDLPEQITYTCAHCGKQETIDCTQDLSMVYSYYNDCYYCEECAWYCDVLEDFFEISSQCPVRDKTGLTYDMPLNWLESQDNDQAIYDGTEWIFIK